jgi:hypothetical protein
VGSGGTVGATVGDGTGDAVGAAVGVGGLLGELVGEAVAAGVTIGVGLGTTAIGVGARERPMNAPAATLAPNTTTSRMPNRNQRALSMPTTPAVTAPVKTLHASQWVSRRAKLSALTRNRLDGHHAAMHSKLSAISMFAIAALAAACTGATPRSAAPTSPPTALPTLAPTSAATLAPTLAPTAAPTPGPTAPVTAAPTQTAGDGFPNSFEDLLVSYVGPDYQASCKRYPPTYDTELASIECGPDDLLFDFTLFRSKADMDIAYQGDLDLGDKPIDPNGQCSDANYEDAYSVGDAVAGRVNCRQHTSSSSGSLYHVIEWTNDELFVVGYVSNRADLRSWQDLIDFWTNDAGPFAP